MAITKKITVNEYEGFITASGTNGDSFTVSVRDKGADDNIVSSARQKVMDYIYNARVTNGGSGYISDPTIVIGDAWQADTAYELNDQVFSGENLYTVTTAGTSDSTAPSGTTLRAEEGADGKAKYTYVGKVAKATLMRDGDKVGSITITESGSGYRVAPSITFTGGGGSGAEAEVSVKEVKTSIMGWVVVSGDIEIKVERNGKALYEFPKNFVNQTILTEGYIDRRERDGDIKITFTGTADAVGTITLKIRKDEGFAEFREPATFGALDNPNKVGE